MVWILELTENPLKNWLSPTIGWFSTHFSGRKPPNSPTEGRLPKIQNGRFTRKSSTFLRQHPNFQCCINIPGWWYNYPSEKYEFVSWDDDIPNLMGKIIHSCSKPPTRYIRGVPKIGVPISSHPFIDGFSLINQPFCHFGDPPFAEPPHRQSGEKKNRSRIRRGCSGSPGRKA